MGGAYVEDRFEIAAPYVALTYDDGPSDWTLPVLDRLAETGNTATFFVVGASITDEHGGTLRRIADCGCEVGSHGYSHQPLTSLSDDEIRREFLRTNALIEAATGIEVRCWRPPYLIVDERVREAVEPLGLVEVSGSVMAKDWVPGVTPAQILETVTHDPDFKRGAVVVLHDGRAPGDGDASAATREATVEATTRIAAILRESRLRSVTVSELLEAT